MTLPSGAEALEAAVELFYDKNVKDERVNEMFENADMDALKRHQFNFLRFAFSKQRYEYTGKDIFEAHKDLMLHKNLGVFHFDCVAENLVATLRWGGISGMAAVAAGSRILNQLYHL